MTIVVAGGTGLIGSRLVARLAADGHRVFLLTRNPTKTGDPGHPGVQPVLWNPVGDFGWMQVVDGADAVINLAGEPMGANRWSASQKERITASRVNATSAIVEAIHRAQSPPSVLVNGSAVGIYGDVPEGDITEASAPGSGFLSDSCIQWEAAALEAKKPGTRVVLLRTGVVLASNALVLRRMLLPFSFFVGGPVGTGRQWLSWIHHEDMISAILFALEKKSLSGPVNLTAPEPVRMKTFAATLGRVVRRPSWFPVPSFLVKALFGEMSIMVLGGQRVLPERLLKSKFTFRHPTLESALREELTRT